MSGETADTLGAHGVALVRHGGAADLVRLERFLDLLQVRQQPKVGANLVRGRAEGSKSSEDVGVDFARVCPDDAFSGSGG